MSVELKTRSILLLGLRANLQQQLNARMVMIETENLKALLADAEHAHQLHALINNPHTGEFLEATRIEAAHQRDRFGDAHDRGKSAENWFWLVGYLAGKCLRAVISGDKAKALHHTISSAAALANWYEAIKRDESGIGAGQDKDIRPIEVAHFQGTQVPVVELAVDQYSGR